MRTVIVENAKGILVEEIAKKPNKMELSEAATAPVFPEILPYGIDLALVERLATQYMTAVQIGGYLRIPAGEFMNVLNRYPAIREAFDYGRAKTAERATRTVLEYVDRGDLEMTKYLLERKAGWNVPKERETVILPAAPAQASIDGSHVMGLAERQRALLNAPDAEIVTVDAETTTAPAEAPGTASEAPAEAPATTIRQSREEATARLIREAVVDGAIEQNRDS
jgi:hypothetical protein